MFNGARVIGPAIRGILVANIGEAGCFFGKRSQHIRINYWAAADEKVPSPVRAAWVARSST